MKNEDDGNDGLYLEEDGSDTVSHAPGSSIHCVGLKDKYSKE